MSAAVTAPSTEVEEAPVQATAKKAPAKKAAPARKATAKKAPAKKTTAAKTTATARKAPAKKATAAKSTAAKKTTATRKAAEPTRSDVVGQLAEGSASVEAKIEGDELVLTVGKKRTLDDVDEGEFKPEAVAEEEKELTEEQQGFSLSDADDADEPEQQVMAAGATADPVKDYLKQIGKVALLNAEQEVELAKR
ncbi:MAG: sigma-70 factor domain-containing protein, partial [Propionibacteriaceae bacterium]|nr:sigma-70 factor domain-containing protein [Propionibacteriaceae bacterium]